MKKETRKTGINKIEGILKKCNEIRNILLSKNVGKNSQYFIDYGTSFGEEFSYLSRSDSSITDGRNLYDYTHDNSTTYSQDIKHRYIDNKGYYDINSGSLLDDTYNSSSQYSQDIKHTYTDSIGNVKVEYVGIPNRRNWNGEYNDTRASLLNDTHNSNTQYSKDINHTYIDNKGYYGIGSASLLDDTHSANTQYSEGISHKYTDNINNLIVEYVGIPNRSNWRGDYDENSASLLDDTHSANTQYSEDINHKYIDNKGYYDENSASLLEDTFGTNIENRNTSINTTVTDRAKSVLENPTYSNVLFNKYLNYCRKIKVESVNDKIRTNWCGEYGYDNASLLYDTHSADTQYVEDINRTYGNWSSDYISYIDEILGMDIYSRHVDYINDLLANHYITNALRQVEVGVVRNYSVGSAMAGLNTTNQNNMSGKDTKLGEITNYMYSHLLYYGAVFNSDRRSNEKYLTPNLYNWYGNNLSNVYRLTDIARIGTNDYRLSEDPGSDVKIIHDFSENISANQLNLKYLTEAIDNGEKFYTEERPKANHIKLGTGSYMNVQWDFDSGETTRDNIDDNIYCINKDKYNQTPEEKVYVDTDVTNNGTFVPDSNSSYKKIDVTNTDSILYKTQKMFEDKKIQTMIGRFCSNDYNEQEDFGIVDTTRSKYGNAHGRNLLTKKAQESKAQDYSEKTNGYINPYCRDWTVFHQYSEVKNLIRPFVNDDGELKTISDVQSVMQRYRSVDRTVNEDVKIKDGGQRLAENTVLGNNGFVNIAPSGNQEDGTGIRIENCMFSLENLAWKDVTIKDKNDAMISKEQIGPNGGRIMWFPPYGLNFQESVNVNWNENSFIGRGEKVYTYTDTVRTGSLSFILLIDHPAIVNSMANLDESNENIQDVDGEILRYFAGCSIPELPEQNESTEVEDSPSDSTKGTKTIKFYTYFPNNYSGSLTNTSDGNSGMRLNEPYWWEYILLGNNCGTYADKNLWLGYEMKNEGISKTYTSVETQSEIQEDWIEATIDCNGTLGQDYSAYTKKEGADKTDPEGPYCYKYRVDSDRAQVLGNNNPTSDNYKDLKSSKLNSDVQNGEDYTFSEIVYCLLKADKLTPDSNFTKADICSYLEENGLVRTSECSQLISELKDESFSITSIDADGSASHRDTTYSTMLAKRRANSVKNLFSEYDIEALSNGKTAEATDGQNNSTDISGDDDKEQRCVLTTIQYEVSSIQALSETDADATHEETATEQIEEQNLFDTWYSALTINSELVRTYEMALPTGEFAKELKDWMDASGKTYDISEYTEDEQWIDVIRDYTEDCPLGAKYLVPAYCISGSSFMDLLKTENPESEVIAIQNLTMFYEVYHRLSDFDIENYKNSSTTNGYWKYADSAITDYELPIKIYKEEVFDDDKYTLSFNYMKKDYLLINNFYINDSGNTNTFYYIIKGLFNSDKRAYLTELLYTNYVVIHALNDGTEARLKDVFENFLFKYMDGSTITFTGYKETIQAVVDSGYDFTIMNESAKWIKNTINTYTSNIITESIQNGNNEANAAEEAKKKEETEMSKLKQLAKEEEAEAIKKAQEAEAKKKAYNEYIYKIYGRGTSTRYETEAEYFSKLDKDSPLIFKKIKEKFKYFNPAFHSISPEGFNARLNFLQQCTRQGSTYEPQSDATGARAAGNLAFGRMPVCILRIGDFIKTRVIINSIQIDYNMGGDVQWDLNPEGIGVQPMFAKVSLNVTLLGGQSLAGPINRLQNAISFNYYANTEVYDDRADISAGNDKYLYINPQ